VWASQLVKRTEPGVPTWSTSVKSSSLVEGGRCASTKTAPKRRACARTHAMCAGVDAVGAHDLVHLARRQRVEDHRGHPRFAQQPQALDEVPLAVVAEARAAPQELGAVARDATCGAGALHVEGHAGVVLEALLAAGGGLVHAVEFREELDEARAHAKGRQPRAGEGREGVFGRRACAQEREHVTRAVDRGQGLFLRRAHDARREHVGRDREQHHARRVRVRERAADPGEVGHGARAGERAVPHAHVHPGLVAEHPLGHRGVERAAHAGVAQREDVGAARVVGVDPRAGDVPALLLEAARGHAHRLRRREEADGGREGGQRDQRAAALVVRTGSR
jgi:hypothetical protein